MRDYEKYGVWVKSYQLKLYVYKKVLTLFPKSEQLDLVSPLKRATCSVPLNIAEGCGRNTVKDFVHFPDIALASTHEAGYCMLFSYDPGYTPKEIYDSANNKFAEVKAKLINLIKSIRKN